MDEPLLFSIGNHKAVVELTDLCDLVDPASGRSLCVVLAGSSY
jgi:hypothetical protein